MNRMPPISSGTPSRATGAMGAASTIAYVGPAVGGNVPDLCRALLGVLRLAAALVLWLEPRTGWLLAQVWAVIQIPVVAWNTDGSPTLQILSLPLAATSQTSVNGQITSYSQIGINLVGVILAIWLNAHRSLFDARYVGREAGRSVPPFTPNQGA